MKRSIWMGVAGALCLMVALGAAASAESIITLAGGAGQMVVFSGQGSGSQGLGVTMGMCDPHGTCTLLGTGTGSGALASSGSFTLKSTANSIVLTPNGAGGFNASASAPIDFTYKGSANGKTGTLLSGALNLVNFEQAQGSANGTFNANLATNLALTGGLLANVFTGNGGELNLNVEFPTTANVSALVGTNLSLTANLPGSGAGGITPTPEPGTLALMGGGLLALGLGLRQGRRRLLAA